MAKLPVILTAVQTTFGHMHYHFFPHQKDHHHNQVIYLTLILTN